MAIESDLLSNVCAFPSPSRANPRRFRVSAIVGYLILGTISSLGGRVLWRSVPFELASYAAWAGIFLAVFALGSLIRVPRWLGLRKRAQVVILFGLGVAVTTTALMWPGASGNLRSTTQRRLDDFLPEYQTAEYHEARTNAPLARVVESMHQVSDVDMPGVVLLTWLRALAHGQLAPPIADPVPIFIGMARPDSGFLVLDDSNRAELVYGMVSRPWSDDPPPKVSGPAAFLSFATPGYVRIAFDFRVVDEGANGVKITTETRILGNDVQSRKDFTWYWRLIYPGSAIIRRVILDTIVERAEAAARPGGQQ